MTNMTKTCPRCLEMFGTSKCRSDQIVCTFCNSLLVTAPEAQSSDPNAASVSTRPPWIQNAANELLAIGRQYRPWKSSDLADVIEKHWRSGGG